MITPIDSSSRLDLFEPGDLTALVCHDVPEVQRIIVEQLSDLGYKIHTGLFVDDILIKMRAHVYDAIVLSAHFSAESFELSPIYLAATTVPPAQRRRQALVLVGSQFSTGDEMQAFAESVDLVVGIADVISLRPVFRRMLLRHQELYAPLYAVEKVLNAA